MFSRLLTTLVIFLEIMWLQWDLTSNISISSTTLTSFGHGVFFLPDFLDFIGGAQFSSLEDFFARTNPDSANFYDFRSVVTPSTVPFKGENIEVAQLSFYAQDEFLVSPVSNLTFGLRVDLPIYITEPVANPFSTGLTLLDENDQPETVDQSKLPGVQPLFSPRAGFNWECNG